MTAQIHDSPAFGAVRPALSVLIPFLKDDPAQLILQLELEAPHLAGAVEVILLDDGTGDADLTARLAQIIATASLPLRLVTLIENQGRSVGRNRLASEARGHHLLFLDSDMKPDRPDFLQAWLKVAQSGRIDIAFGGFSLLQAPRDRIFAVHRAMAAKSDCLTAAQRRLHPEKYVFTSNLLIKKDILETDNFDPDFAGWGWEDVEWAMRVSRHYRVHHLDITATHMGLDRVEDLARKYEQSVPNFARVLAKHPDFVTAYPSYRLARLIRRLPARSKLRAVLIFMVRFKALPDGLRGLGLRLYRATLYAEVV